MPVGTRIQIRRDTAANWSSTNPTLAAGEMGYDTTNGVLKVGDGATTWNSLSVASDNGMIIPQLPYVSTYYYLPSYNLGTRTAPTNTTSYFPFYVQKGATFDRIACATGGGFSGTAVVRLGIYNNDPTTMKPSTVVLDAGTVSCTAATTLYTITISQALNTGLYWLAANMQTAATTSAFLSANTSQNVYNWGIGDATNYWLCYNEASITGAFATAGTVSPSSSPGPLVRLRAQ